MTKIDFNDFERRKRKTFRNLILIAATFFFLAVTFTVFAVYELAQLDLSPIAHAVGSIAADVKDGYNRTAK